MASSGLNSIALSKSFNGKAQAELQMNDLKSAFHDLNYALELKWDYPEPYYTRGVARAELEDYSLALSDLNKALTVLHYEDDEFIQTCNMLGLYRYFSSRNQLQEAKYYLRRAERAAHSIENFELLDIIYGEYIRLSHESLNIDPEMKTRVTKFIDWMSKNNDTDSIIINYQNWLSEKLK